LQGIQSASIQGTPVSEQVSKFINGVNRSRDYIVAGDVFQVNLSRQWQCKLVADTSPTAAGCQIDLVNKSVADGDQQQSQ
jgi:anthranilate synthase component 1